MTEYTLSTCNAYGRSSDIATLKLQMEFVTHNRAWTSRISWVTMAWRTCETNDHPVIASGPCNSSTKPTSLVIYHVKSMKDQEGSPATLCSFRNARLYAVEDKSDVDDTEDDPRRIVCQKVRIVTM